MSVTKYTQRPPIPLPGSTADLALKLPADECAYDAQVEHPPHYQGNKLEAIDVIDAFNLNFSLGNAIKYILRAGKKGSKTRDLEKAIWYIKHEISQTQENKQ